MRRDHLEIALAEARVAGRALVRLQGAANADLAELRDDELRANLLDRRFWTALDSEPV